MQTTIRGVLVGLIAVALAGCGGSAGGGSSTTDVAQPAACQPDASGSCRNDSPPPEPTPMPQCTADSECPPLRAACSVCADGTSACPRSVCEKGQCNVVMPTCAQPSACGGIAGLPCAMGYICEDDPQDECTPDSGTDCPGVCVPDKQPPFCGGIAGFPCPEGYECVDDPADNCDPATGADCGGLCQPISTTMCQSGDECAQLRAPCSVCADGSSACPRSVCEKGQCNVVMPTCPAPASCGGIASVPCPIGNVCEDDPNDSCDPESGADCPGICVPPKQPPFCGGIAGFPCPEGYECIDDPSDDCDPAKGGADCGGICQPMAPACQTDEECSRLQAPCSVCPDGTLACPKSACVNGQCIGAYPACPKPEACGGIAGTPCQRGYECVDDAGDNCDPASGADCPGVCIPAAPPPPPRCGGFAGETCPDGFTCVDDPSDACDPANGGADCGGLCQPAESRQCKADSECPIIGAPCSMCADGTTACPRSFCKDGQCAAVIEACAKPLP